MKKEGPSAGYGIIGSLYRAGPVPFFQRIVNADTYEQAVLKYMAQEGCDRMVSDIINFIIVVETNMYNELTPIKKF
jgi:hypothetical protein